MSDLSTLLYNVRCFLGVVCRLIWYGVQFCWALLLPKVVLAARLTASESQLGELAERVRRETGAPLRLQSGPAFRIIWVVLSKLLEGWEGLAHLMKPETVVSRHRSAFRSWWRWRSKPGRKLVPVEMQHLIRRLSKENPLWGAERIRDTLLLLGYEPPEEDTIWKYMVKPRKPRPKSTNWLPFLRSHLDVCWAIDFFAVTTVGSRVLHVFPVFDNARRKVLYVAVKAHPTMECVIQQLREATPFGRQPRYVFSDNGGIFGYGVRAFLERCGIQELRAAYRSPWQNPYIKRMIGTLPRELLNHVIVLGQWHLKRLLREYLEQYYHTARPHQGLDGETPIPLAKANISAGGGELIAIPVVGGLHHRYQRLAA